MDTITYFSLKIDDILTSSLAVANVCSDYLINGPPVVLPDGHLSASSVLIPHGQHTIIGSERARLYQKAETLPDGTVLFGAWSPAQDKVGEYVQVEFGDLALVNGVVTQGRNLEQGNTCCQEYITKYQVYYTEDGVNWNIVPDPSGNAKNFQGNQDTDTPVTNTFDCPVFARAVRIVPMEWNQHMALRFDLIGCHLEPNNGNPIMMNKAPTAPPISLNKVNSVTSMASSTPSTPITEIHSTLKSTLQVTTNSQHHTVQCVPVSGGCQNLPNGDYQSCTSCNHYITCNFGIAIERPCQLPSLVWDDILKECLFKSPTCP